MDKRALLGITLSVLVLIGYQNFINYYYGPQPTESPAPTGVKSEPEKTSTPPKPAPDSVPAPPQAGTPRLAPAQSATEVRVDTDNYSAIFTTQGARLKSFKFKKFRTSADEKSPPFEIVSSAAGVPLPLGVSLQASALFEDSALVYALEGSDLQLTGAAKGKLLFQGQTPNGAVITKALSFSGDSYVIGLEVAAKSGEGAALPAEVLLTDKSDHSVANHDAPFEGYLALVDNKIKREAPSEAIKGHEFSGDISWAGFGHTYFLIALVPENGAQHKISVRQVGTALLASIAGPAGSGRYSLFIGPKELDLLQSVGKGIERAID